MLYFSRAKTYLILLVCGLGLLLSLPNLSPRPGWLPAAVGLAGKVLGPLGLAELIWSGTWPARTAVLCITNDLIWWLPFGLYLYDAWPGFGARPAPER